MTGSHVTGRFAEASLHYLLPLPGQTLSLLFSTYPLPLARQNQGVITISAGQL